MNIIVLPSPIHLFVFFLLRIICYKLKPLYFIITKGDNKYLPFEETNKSINK